MHAPYGEQLLNQHAGTYDERFKFTGKERDVETGFDYFGARYYWPVGIWTSVDPLVDNFIDKTPYLYCEGNPIRFVDPDGRLPDAIWDVAWIAWDGVSFLYNTVVGNNQEAAMDAACFTADVATLFVPGMPAVSGPARASAKIVPKVAETAPKVAKAMEKVKKTFQTYIKMNPNTGEVYVGRTSGTKSPLQNVKARDSKHHKSAEGFGPAEI